MPALAANSILRYLSAEFGLKLCEWKNFYRLLDEAALLHIFRVASSLDSLVLGEPQIVSQVKAAWAQAQKANSTGRYLDAVSAEGTHGFEARAQRDGYWTFGGVGTDRCGGTGQAVAGDARQ